MRKCFAAAVGVVMLAIAAALFAADAEDLTLDAQGNVGRASYVTLPFCNDVAKVSWGSNAGLSPTVLHWEAGTFYADPANLRGARGSSAALIARGVVPLSSSQRWQDTYMAALPPVPGEPKWVVGDRANEHMATRGDYQAWAAWEKAHANLFILKADGGQVEEKHGSWSGNWGHISPLMPLPKADWPEGRTNVTYGEWYACKWGQVAKLAGFYGLGTSDFSDSQPHRLSYEIGFNPEIIAGFEQSIGQKIPGATIAEKSAYINTNLFSQWNDHLCDGYGKFFAQLAAEIKLNVGHEALVADQGSRWPSVLRLYGVDDRIIARTMSGKNFIHYNWDALSMSPERGGQSMIYGLGGSVLAAAREPDIRMGANMSADNAAFWIAVAKFWGGNNPALVNNPKLTAADVPADLRERGYKELKRAWLEHAWAHIADRQAKTRRALCQMSRYYWDGGKIDPRVQELIQSIVPTRPFGMALYYSVDTERKVEAELPLKHGTQFYYVPEVLMHFKNAGGVVNYYVSDAGLAQMTPASPSTPAAWIVLDRPELLSPAEREKLASIAPIVTTLAEAENFAPAPLKFANTQLTGDGFYDQDDRLIILATNLTATDIGGATVSLRGLADGNYVATDLFSQAQINFTVANSVATVPIDVTRWDTRVLAITPAKP